LSAVGSNDVRTDMSAIESHAVADRFARVREAFHRLVEVDLSQRHAALQALSQSDPEIAAELRLLLDRMDEADLLAAPEQAPPSRLGPFRLLHRIGRGGMGEVWLAERVEGGFEQQVALKRVREAALTPDLARRFVRERQILARLQHPNIAHLIDGGVGPDGRPWLAMEYVPGERITHWCHARQLDAVARVRLFLPVCEAVAFAHRNLIVHRDLKPANIQVDAEGRPKLLDFGVARLLDPQDTDQTRTVGAMTPAYAAPEQREGAAITTATDVYQLGVVLRELIDATPDAGSEPGQAVETPSRTAFALLRGDLGRILAKACATLPADRYASVTMFADDLSDWLQRRPLRSGIGSRRERLRKTLWQWRWPLAMLAVVVLALGGGALLAWREARLAQASERNARANFDALLSVIGSANPGRFAGREPTVGEALIDAATRLERDFAHDPRLLRETLSEIGHGLLNLGRGRDAEPILRAALDAAEGDPAVTPGNRLGLLKLLVISQDEAPFAESARVTASRIVALALQPETPRGAALDTIASAAGSLSRLGDHAGADRLFAQADMIDPDGTEMSVSQRENYWRQRGWNALRSNRLDEAGRAFATSRAAQDVAPGQISAVRRAELDLLMAQTALADGDRARANAALDAAQPVWQAEYPPGHPERTYFDGLRARARSE
jgi:tRNA A-37 threonylcarbamoyl transferase component Bud32